LYAQQERRQRLVTTRFAERRRLRNPFLPEVSFAHDPRAVARSSHRAPRRLVRPDVERLAAEREHYRELYLRRLEQCRKLELGLLGQKSEGLGGPGEASAARVAPSPAEKE
jgi:hypothetical protein